MFLFIHRHTAANLIKSVKLGVAYILNSLLINFFFIFSELIYILSYFYNRLFLNLKLLSCFLTSFYVCYVQNVGIMFFYQMNSFFLITPHITGFLWSWKRSCKLSWERCFPQNFKGCQKKMYLNFMISFEIWKILEWPYCSHCVHPQTYHLSYKLPFLIFAIILSTTTIFFFNFLVHFAVL